jgi:hypothetical protein
MYQEDSRYVHGAYVCDIASIGPPLCVSKIHNSIEFPFSVPQYLYEELLRNRENGFSSSNITGLMSRQHTEQRITI